MVSTLLRLARRLLCFLNRLFAHGAFGIGFFAFSQPRGKLLGRFQRDAAQCGYSEIVDDDVRGFGEVDAPTALHRAALATNRFQHFFVGVVGHVVDVVALVQLIGVVGDKVVKQLKRHGFFVKRVHANRAAGGEVETALLDDDARPEHARCVVQIKIIGQRNALLGFGDAGFVTRFGRAFAFERVDEGGLANVGNAANQYAHGLGHAATVGGELLAVVDQRFGGRGHAGVKTNGAHAGHGVVMGQPHRGACGVGQILLAQHLECGFALNQLSQHWVGTRAGQAGVEHFDDNVNLFDALPNRFAREVHVSGEPLNSHSLDCRSRGVGGHLQALMHVIRQIDGQLLLGFEVMLGEHLKVSVQGFGSLCVVSQC